MVASAGLEVGRTCGLAATARDCQHQCECQAKAAFDANDGANQCDTFVFVPADADACGGQALCQLLRKDSSKPDGEYVRVEASPGAVSATFSGATSLPGAPPLRAGRSAPASLRRSDVLLLRAARAPLPPRAAARRLPPPTLAAAGAACCSADGHPPGGDVLD